MLLRSIKDMIGYKILAKDGEIGKVDDFYFDDRSWGVRYIVDKTGIWLFGRQVLISTASFEKPDWDGKQFPVSITKDQVENSPPIDAKKPVSKENEEKLNDYYGWPVYWGGFGGTGGAGYTGAVAPSGVGYTGAAAASGAGYAGAAAPYPLGASRTIATDDALKDEGLRSIDEMTGYDIISEGKSTGYVEDFIVDDESWAIRYLVLDTKKYFDGKKVIIAPEWIHGISWSEKHVSIDISKGKLQNCPDVDISKPISREYEELIYNYYGRTKYWE